MKIDDERQLVVLSLGGETIAEWDFQKARLNALWLIEATSLASTYFRAWMKAEPNQFRPTVR